MHIAYRWFAEKWRGHTVNTAIAKCICMFLFIVFSFTEVNAQTVSSSVLSATGGAGTVSNITAEWSIGGTAVTATMVLPNGQVLTQGFLQPADTVQLTLTFNALAVKTYGDPDFVLLAIAGNGAPIDYVSSDQTVAQIVNGDSVKIIGAGTANITATIRGTTISKIQPLVANKASQVITFAQIPVQLKGAKYDLSGVKASSGLPVTFTIADPSIATVEGTTLGAVNIGVTTITATQNGDGNYEAATSTIQTVTVADAAGDDIIVHQAVSPNGDGINDFLYIEGIQNYPKNELTLMDRNGVMIFQSFGYDNSNHVFDGHSNITGALQQAGTYFYRVEFIVNGERKNKRGFFVLKYK